MSWLLRFVLAPFRVSGSASIRVRCRQMLCAGLLMGVLFMGAHPASAQIFVDANSPAGLGDADGTSWNTAYPELTLALEAADEESEIWVAQGTYTPPIEDETARDSSFVIDESIESVSIYGGFVGNETSLDDRPTPVDPTATILSGDINQNSTPDGNSYHVVIFDQVFLPRLDGFTIRGGQANGTAETQPDLSQSVGGGIACVRRCSPRLENLIIEDNIAEEAGGGVYLASIGESGAQVSPTMRNVRIRGNETNGQGGGLFVRSDNQNTGTPPTNAGVTAGNLVLSGNRADQGGGLYVEVVGNGTGGGSLINATVHGNYAETEGGGVYYEMEESTLGGVAFSVEQNIIAGNDAGDSASQVGGTADPEAGFFFTHTLIEGAFEFEGNAWDNDLGINDGNNIDGAPFFLEPIDAPANNAPTTAGDLRLNWASAAIDRADADLLPNDPGEGGPFLPTDIDGNDRVLGDDLDMGAYEGGRAPMTETVFVDASASLPADGGTWTSAYTNLQDGLRAVRNARAGAFDQNLDPEDLSTLQVAEGTYYTSESRIGSDEDAGQAYDLFVMPGGTVIEGGFAAGGGERDPEETPTVLSGAIENPMDELNSYTVVAIWNSNVVLDGFTIQEGQASNVEGDDFESSAGGIFVGVDPDLPEPDWLTDVELVNLTLRNNEAAGEGGGLFIEGGSPIDGHEVDLQSIAFERNQAGGPGGGLYAGASASVFGENLVFIQNTTTAFGAAGAIVGGSAILQHVTTFNNELEGGALNGSAFFVDGTTFPGDVDVSGTTFPGDVDVSGTLDLFNSIVWEAETTEDALVTDDLGTTNLEANLVSGGEGAISGDDVALEAIIDADPLFVSAENETVAPTDLQLNWASPAIRQGSTTLEPATVEDFGGTEREAVPTLGAFEGGAAPSTDGPFYVDATASDDTGGGDWSNPYQTLQAALTAISNAQLNRALGFDEVAEVWVAEGTYTPAEGPGLEATADPTKLSFFVPEATHILGGFSGTESNADERNSDPATNNTVLSGDLGNGENSESVVRMEVFDPDDPDIESAALRSLTVADGRLVDPMALDPEELQVESPQAAPMLDMQTGSGEAFAAGVSIVEGAPLLEDLRIVNHESEAEEDIGGSAAGLYCGDCSATFDSIDFENNVTQFNASAALITAFNEASVTLRNIRFVDNEAVVDGATLGVSGAADLDVVLHNGIFESNIAAGELANLAIGASEGTTTVDIANTLFADNTSGEAGAEGLLVATGTLVEGEGAVDVDLAQTTWRASDNTKPLLDVDVGEGSEITIANSILAGSTQAVATENASSENATTILSSLVENGWEGPGSDIIDDDPQLNTENRLLGNSLAIDAGDGDRIPADVLDLDDDGDTTEPLPVDLDGNSRVLADAVDLGAFEGGATPRALTDDATDIGFEEATLNATINPYSEDDVAYAFRVEAVGESLPPQTIEAGSFSGSENETVSETVTDLLPDTEYQYRIEGTNQSDDTSTGPWLTFTTNEALLPTAESASYTVDAGETTTIEAPGILENDDLGEPEADLTTITIDENDWAPGDAIDFAGGTLTVSEDGSFTVDNPMDAGEATFDYTLQNIEGESSATVTVDVAADPPEADDDAVITDANTPVDIDVFDFVISVGGGLDPDGLNIESGPDNGTLEDTEEDGVVTYTPDTDFVGEDAFTYTVASIFGLISAEATVNITVEGDAPVAEAISFDADVNETLTVDAPGILENDNLGSPEAELTTITIGETDWNPGDAIDFAGGTLTVEADGSLTLDDPTEVGEATFDYTIENDAGESTATVTIMVEGDAPVAEAIDFDANVNETLTVDAPGILENDALGSPEAEFTTITVGETDWSPGDAIDFAGGTLTVAEDGAFTLEDPADVGSFDFDYTIENAAGESTATVTIDVAGDAPVAEAIGFDANVNETLTVEAPGILENDNLGSPDAELTTITVGETDWSPGNAIDFAGGTLTVEVNGSLTLDDPTEVGEATFDYTIENDAGESTATVTIDVSGDAPVAEAIDFEVEAGATLSVEPPGILENDDLGIPTAELAGLTLDGDTAPLETDLDFAGGTLNVAPNGEITLTEPTEEGTSSFEYTIENEAGTSTAVVAVTVTEVASPAPVPATLATTAVGVEGIEQQVVVENTGSSEVPELSGSLESEEHFTLIDEGGDGPLQPGDSQAFTLAFTPQEAGVQTTPLTVTADGEVISIFDLEAKAIAVGVAAEDAIAGESASVTVSVSDNFEEEDVQVLQVRPAGTISYDSVTLTASGDNEWTGSVPEELVTPQGLDVFVELTDETGPVVFPEATAERAANAPLHLQVDVPSVAAGGDFAPEQYRMVSLPIQLNDNALSDVLADTYGPYDPDEWRFFQWQADEETYAEFPEVDDVDRGNAAWLITRSGEGFEVADGQSIEADAPFEQTLQPGWNQISTPFGFAVNWSDVDVADTVEEPVAFTSATEDGSPEYVYNQEQLVPWEGYFVFNNDTSPVTLTIPPVDATDEDEPAAIAQTSLDSDDTDYTVQVTAEMEEAGLRHTQTFFGFDRGTADTPTTFVAAPPVDPHVQVRVGEDEPKYAGHHVPRPSDGYAWNLEVSATSGGAFQTDQTVRVRLHEEGALPADFDLYLFDPEAEAPVTLQNQRFDVELPSGTTSRTYRVVVGDEAYAEQEADGIPLEAYENELHVNYPNPMTEETTIEYELGASGSVDIDIYNILGQRVRRLVDTDQDAGFHTVRWDGRTDGGQRVASGVYFIRLRTGDFTESRKVTVVR